jgi:hypothetical protein
LQPANSGPWPHVTSAPKSQALVSCGHGGMQPSAVQVVPAGQHFGLGPAVQQVSPSWQHSFGFSPGQAVSVGAQMIVHVPSKHALAAPQQFSPGTQRSPAGRQQMFWRTPLVPQLAG